MHLQSELENYKLQVELLQEKLHRSEDNRQELEGKLEQIMKKRNEHERSLRSRSQRKYQQFLDEQKKRNDRNRRLVEMLERIDHQASALSARSERLKMMKLQYELYFSKLVQSHSMKTIQHIPNVPFLPIQRLPNTYTAIEDDKAPGEVYQAPFTGQFPTVPIPVMVPIPNDQNRLQHSWALATTPQGIITTLPPDNSVPSSTDMVDSKKNESNFRFDYSQFPIGYLQTRPTTANPTQHNLDTSYRQQPVHEKPLTERMYSKSMFAPDDDLNPSEYRDQSFPSSSYTGAKTNEAISKRMQSEPTDQKIFDLYSNKSKGNDDSKIIGQKGNGHEPENLPKQRQPETFSNDSSVPRQSLKADKLPNINPNNSFRQATQEGRSIHRGNNPNTIDFRTDDDEYIKYIKEMKETYEKNVPIPINVTPQEHSIDNITTTLQEQKIDETNVRDDEKINDAEDNERNTSSAFPPLGGKCSIESIGDEALAKKPLENKTGENTSNTDARNIDSSRDTEQITLFNGTKNSRDESIGASNRTAAIIDGVGEHTEATRSETSYRPMHFDKKEKMSIENIETAIYGELLTKPQSLTPVGLLDKSLGNVVAVEEATEQETQETEKYEFSHSGKDLYEQEQEPVMEDEHQVESHSGSDAKNNEVTEYNQDSYNYADGEGSTGGMQEYDMQNYNYPDAVQDYKDMAEGEPSVAQQDYSYTEGGELQPQTETYATDYQNYDPSQYQGEYDTNSYQYDYDQQQYIDPTQAQYTAEMYNQEYQQDPYSGEYANYEQTASNEVDPSNQQYAAEQKYIPEEQEPTREDIVSADEKVIDTKTDTPVENVSIAGEPSEDVSAQKPTTPASILATDKPTDIAAKKKKRVNFVDSETDDSSTLPKPDAVSSESDFDFSANQ